MTEPGYGFSPLSHRREAFSRFVIVQALSSGGDGIVALALAGSLFFDISPSAASSRVALSLVLTVLPFGVVAPLLGPAMDRHPQGRRAMLVLAGAGRAVTALIMASNLNSLVLFPTAFLSLVCSKAFSIARSALVPVLVKDEERLVEANARLSLISTASGFIFIVPGYVVQHFIGSNWTLRCAAIAFSTAAIMAVRIDVKSASERAAERSRFVAVTNSVQVAAVAMAMLRGIVGFTAFLIAFSFRRTDADTWMFGVVVALSSIGTFLGAVVAPPARRLIREERILVAALVMVACGAIVSTRLDGLGAACVLSLVVANSTSVGKMAFDSLAQRDSPPSDHGRIMARFEAGFQLVWVLGALMPVRISIPLRFGAIMIALTATVVAVVYGFGGWAALRRRF